ncbi:hypothetical protein [Streptomyces sp. Ag109_O5-1]|uniref:hypothetical protein n=1 Tax=Streptomyces sp. Ag109_O5-1 TaxID=1938851 RepID=UPI000F4DF699|nr:hypothetical protein [Streptomyces sp. Ag109_O5-1]
MWTRTTVTVLCWGGDTLRAVEVVSRLVDNGHRHGVPPGTPQDKRRLLLSIALMDTGALVIEVADLDPSFLDFDAAVRGERGRGLWHVFRMGAVVTRHIPEYGDGKTVRAVLTP